MTRRVRQLCKLFVGPQANSSHGTRARNVLNTHNPRRAPSLAFTKTTIKRMLGSPTCEVASYLSSPLPNRMNRCLHLRVGPYRCLILVCTTPHTYVVCFAAHLRSICGIYTLSAMCLAGIFKPSPASSHHTPLFVHCHTSHVHMDLQPQLCSPSSVSIDRMEGEHRPRGLIPSTLSNATSVQLFNYMRSFSNQERRFLCHTAGGTTQHASSQQSRSCATSGTRPISLGCTIAFTTRQVSAALQLAI